MRYVGGFDIGRPIELPGWLPHAVPLSCGCVAMS